MAMLEDKLINGVSGIVTAVIDGNVIELAEITKISATAEKITTDYRAMGKFATQTKANGWKGTGSMTLRYGTSIFRNMLLDYAKTGKNTYISIIVINNPTFQGGEIKTRLGGVNITSAVITQADVDTDILDEEVPFTFTEMEDLA